MPTDENLARGIQQGRHDDLIVLVERHYPALFGYLYRMTGGDRMLSEDMIQDTFLRVLRGIESYTYPRPFKPWLYAIATNLARNYYSSADSRHTTAVEDETTLEDEMPYEMEADDETNALLAALRSLPQHQREVIVLRYSHEMALTEISEVLGIPVGTVKSRLSIGLQRLRERMEQTR
jgi:RNA polymerase sigma-70 factor (ECF subfamily)